jgi:small subunit ribosomal protein S4
MARYIGPVCRLCRREGVKLMLKSVRCESAKCPMEKQWRSNPPGMHSWRRGKGSNYLVRLREKQKVKRYYGVFEKQFKRYFEIATHASGNTGEELLQLLERRLDNVVWKLGFAVSKKSSRQTVVHGHITVNGRKVDRPSYRVKQSDVVSVRSTEKSQKYVKTQLGESPAPLQSWLERDDGKMEGRVMSLPTREHIQIPVEEQLIVEMCSR